MFPRSSGEEYSFIISMGGFADGGPYLQHSSVRGFCLDRYSNVVEQNEDCEPIHIFEEIQKNLKEGTWFFVDEYSWDKTKAAGHWGRVLLPDETPFPKNPSDGNPGLFD
jgi:hypothetical protein